MCRAVIAGLAQGAPLEWCADCTSRLSRKLEGKLMSIEDLRTLPTGADLNFDVCVVGAGVAGFGVALQFLGTRYRVLVVESGGDTPEAEINDLSEIENAGARRAPQALTRARCVGGTSSLWSGRCGVFDPIDFAARNWIPHSGWPISEADVRPYYDRAGALLGLGPSSYRGHAAGYIAAEAPTSVFDRRTFEPVVFQFSVHDPSHQQALRTSVMHGVEGAEHIGVLQHAGAPKPTHFGEAYRSLLEAAPNITLLKHATATEVLTNADTSQAMGVSIASIEGHRATVAASIVVLCCGGIDNARLLLASRSKDPRGVGNRHDTVGRYLTDHPFTVIASYQGEGSRGLRRMLGHRWIDRDNIRHVYTIGARLAAERQRAEGLLNGAIHIVDWGGEGSAMREAKVALGMVRSGPQRLEGLSKLSGLMLRPDKIGFGAYERYLLKRPSLSSPERVDFGCVVEQLPDPESRVVLSSQLDGLGRPRARLQWRVSEREFETLVRMSDLFDEEVRRLGFVAPDRVLWRSRGVTEWCDSVHDMAHPMGATRMSRSPEQGVVDQDCRVHGVDGLYIAGSSVFATSGYMNPTLLLLSLSLRLADHLKQVALRQRAVRDSEMPRPRVHDDSAIAAIRPELGAIRRLKVGIVGAGRRICETHLPVLRALSAEFEVVGIVGSPKRSTPAVNEKTGLRAFETAKDLVSQTSPDMLIVAVSTDAVDEVLPQMVELGVPLLVETPFCWNVRIGRRTLAKMRETRGLVSVCEQTPFLPIEQLRQQVIELGLLGRVHTAENNGVYFDYHAIGALRCLLGSGRRPAMARATAAGPASGDGQSRSGSVEYDDGATLRHRSLPADSPAAVVVEGTSGSMVNDTLIYVRDGVRVESKAIRETIEGRLAAIVLPTPDGEIRWTNPFADHSFQDDQIGVATLLRGMRDAVLFGVDPPYAAAEGLADMDLVTAIEYSARRGGPAISLPLKARLERLRCSSPAEVLRRLTSRRSSVLSR